MNKIFKYIVLAAALMLSMGLASCSDDLHVAPIDPGTKTEVYASQLFNKCYANFGTAGNGGANGDCDIDGIDGGTSGLYRQLWNCQELTTDEAMCKWGDDGIAQFNYNTYDATHPMTRGLYYRLCVGVAYCNQYLKAFSDSDAVMTAEVRFLRAYQYYILMDQFGNVPFTTTISSDAPEQIKRADLYNWLVTELKDICGEGSDNSAVLADAAPHAKGDNRWGRVDKAAAWLLLSRLYLNGGVYAGTPDYDQAAIYAKKVIDSGYELCTEGSSHEVTSSYNGESRTQTWKFSAYQKLFMGDNGTNGANREAIFPILQDGKRTTSWGCALFLIGSTHDGDMHDLAYDEWFSNAKDRSVNGVTSQAWAGNRCRPELIRKFFPNDDAPSGYSYQVVEAAEDDRALFDTKGRTLDITDPDNFASGYATGKFTNFTTDGTPTSDATFPDMNVFLMRKAEAYLIYAEALTRKAGDGTAPGLAVDAINTLRSRAHAATRSTYTLGQIEDEWSREFYFEGLRRTTLERFGDYAGLNASYKWQWKGGVYNGRNFDSYRSVFALPNTDIIANPNLHQNDGYK